MLMSGRIISTVGEAPTPLSFDSVLELSCHMGVSFILQIGDQGLVEFDLSSWTHLILIGFMLRPWTLSFFQKLCPAPLLSV